MSEWNIEVGTQLDTSGIQQQLNGVKPKPIEIDAKLTDGSLKNIKSQLSGLFNGKSIPIDIDTRHAGKGLSGFRASLQREIAAKPIRLTLDEGKLNSQIDSIERRISALDGLKPRGSGKQANDYIQLKTELSEISRLAKEVSKLDIDKNSGDIEVVSGRLEKLKKSYTGILRTFEQNKLLSGGQIAELNNILEKTEFDLDRIKAKMQDAFNVQQAKLNEKNEKLRIGIEADFDYREFEKQVESVKSAYRNLHIESEAVEDGIKDLDRALHNLDVTRFTGNADEMRVALDRYKRELQGVKNDIAITKLNEVDQHKRQSLIDDIDIWKKRNSAAHEYFVQLDNIQRAAVGANKAELEYLRGDFDSVKKNAIIEDKTGMDFKDRLKNQFDRYGGYFAVSFGFMEAAQAVRSMYNEVVKVDTAMTELKRVTDLSSAQYDDLYSDLTVSAREYGVTLSDIISATADWSRSGFSPDEAKGLAEVTTMYQHIADLDYKTAFENLQTAYKGFEGELTNMFGGDTVAAVSYIGDILNELDNNYAVTAAGVGEALKRSASALDVAGNSVQETAG